VLEAEANKHGEGQVVSQSAQFAPFTHDYLFQNDTTDKWQIFDESLTMANTYRGSAVYVYLLFGAWPTADALLLSAGNRLCRPSRVSPRTCSRARAKT
jgi:hypothetical protein